MSEKTEQPTARRLRKVRSEGDSPVSGALSQAVAFFVAILLVPGALVATADAAAGLFQRALHRGIEATPMAELCLLVVTLTVPVVAATALAAAVVGLVQTGGVFALQRVVPDLQRANPLSGLKNLVSASRLVSLLRSLLAALVVGYIAVLLLESHLPDLAHVTGNLPAAAPFAGTLSRRLAYCAALVGLALAGVDLLITRWTWFRRHRMTKDEVKREHRESEGDPEIRAARRRAHQEAVEGNLIGAVKQATVVIVNPTHFATALRYLTEEDEAPRVVSQGRGDLARKIIEAAHAYGVPVIRDVPIARALSELEIGDEIPEALYEAVAAILRDIWEADEGAPQENA